MSSSTRRALRILETVGAAEHPLGATEIGRALGISAGTVFRGLDALERAGYVGRFQSSAKFVLGKTVGMLRQNLFARFAIRDICMPYLRQLAFASGETASLTVRLGWYGVRIAAAPGTNEVTSSPPLGAVRLLGEGCAPRAILASLAAGAVADYSAWGRRHKKPGGDPRMLARALAEIRARGFATEETAFARGRAALAFAVRGGGGAIAAIAIEGPVLDLARPGAHDDLPRWREIVQSVERLVQARPALFAGPFDHLAADDIVLP
jgi:DNA-binding IclR family transcriptional regulator